MSLEHGWPPLCSRQGPLACAQAAVEDWVGTPDPKAVSSIGAGRKCVTAAPWVTTLCCQSCIVLGHGCPGLIVLSLSRAAIEMRKSRPGKVKRPLEYFRFLGNSGEEPTAVLGTSILSLAGSSQGSSVCVNVSFSTVKWG